ncbi:MAG: hypothetical protein CMF72_24665 [Mameliella sp.]|nr:hypothetical protein [Mameliella sp.]
MNTAAETADTAMTFVRGSWVRVELPGGCAGWNDSHDCGREDDHPGDHVCAGCHVQWNRGEWDHLDDEDEAYFSSQRPASRCIDDPAE